MPSPNCSPSSTHVSLVEKGLRMQEGERAQWRRRKKQGLPEEQRREGRGTQSCEPQKASL